jgi:tagaturonate reductase
VLRTAHDPETHVVASNVTESALRLSDDPENDAPDLSPPASFPAKLTRWLLERYRHFNGDPAAAGVAVLPCELIEGNGRLLRDLVGELTARWQVGGGGFADWLETACVFPDTLVDRIVPGTASDEERATLWRERIGDDALDDPLLTIAEPFSLWAIQGDDALAARLRWLIEGSNGAVVVAPDIRPSCCARCAS